MRILKYLWIVFILISFGIAFAQERKELELKWKADPASQSYRVEFSNTSDFQIVLRTVSVNDRTIRFFPESNERYIRVVGIGRKESRGEPSEAILIDSLKPFVKLERKAPPQDKAIILSPTQNEKIVLDNPSSGKNGVKVFFRVNEGEWKEYQGTISGLQEGKNDVEFYSETASGVKETTRLMEVVQDTKRPEIRVEIGKGFKLESVYVTRKDQTLKVEIADAVSGVADSEFYFLQNGRKTQVNPISQNKNDYTFILPDSIEDGSFGIDVKAKDQAGNKTEESFFGILDSNPPICRISPRLSTGELFPIGTEIQIQCEDLISGVRSIQFSQNGGEFRNYAEGLVLDAGKHSFEFRVTDKVGNSSLIKAQYTILNPTLESKVKIKTQTPSSATTK
ncbi:OmpL47-type beta-barrel domain-containing protein [Leptospira kmetyi]|uniref:OmpL47-type beta-barrel domain-containing protein n=1 Tax=Leptospira kmetyi TaxID=408139 RepID=UPI001083F077|nr:Ig-like domain repeat protein [Leptospira kmetyi]TGL72082.1 hypothetical protein EHQ67_02925 [Leptospira kmetyi]